MIRASLLLNFLTLACLVCCAGQRMVVVNAETLPMLGNRCAATGVSLDKGLEGHIVTPARHGEWKKFQKKFHRTYYAAVAMWQAARADGDTETEAEMLVLVNRLAVELMAFDGAAAP